MKPTQIVSHSAMMVLILASLLFGTVATAMAGLATSPFTVTDPTPIGGFVSSIGLTGR